MSLHRRTASLWTRAFALLCLAEFLGYAQHFALQPTLPLYITHLGGSPFIVGLVIAAFGVTSVISRPIIGYWVDRWSETGVMVLGMVGQALSILFCFMPFNAAVIFSNALRGIGWSEHGGGGLHAAGDRRAPRTARRSVRLFRRRAVQRDDYFSRHRAVDHRLRRWAAFARCFSLPWRWF